MFYLFDVTVKNSMGYEKQYKVYYMESSHYFKVVHNKVTYMRLVKDVHDNEWHELDAGISKRSREIGSLIDQKFKRKQPQ